MTLSIRRGRRGAGHHRHPGGDRPPGGQLRAARGRHRLHPAHLVHRSRDRAVPRRARRRCSSRAPTGIVFDLRGNPGGYIVAAQGIASQFVADRRAALHRRVGRGRPGVARRDRRRSRTTSPVVVLVDGGSASASEIVAGRAPGARPRDDRRRADLRQEHGPDLERPAERRRPAATTDRWFTPEHNSVGARRHPARREVVARGPAGDEDPQLDRAVEICAAGSAPYRVVRCPQRRSRAEPISPCFSVRPPAANLESSHADESAARIRRARDRRCRR